jgi:hypothetical protein
MIYHAPVAYPRVFGRLDSHFAIQRLWFFFSRPYINHKKNVKFTFDPSVPSDHVHNTFQSAHSHVRKRCVSSNIYRRTL